MMKKKINETIDYYKEKYEDATHNCVAYLVGTKERANDDGEPSGYCRSSNAQCFKNKNSVILLQLLQDILEALN